MWKLSQVERQIPELPPTGSLEGQCALVALRDSRKEVWEKVCHRSGGYVRTEKALTRVPSMKKLLLFCVLIFSFAELATGQEKHPNVILVFIDDMGWGDFSCFGNEDANTPHIDRLAEEGIAFDQFYVNSPICSPSRVAISTGQYPQKWKITSYLNNRKSNANRGAADWLDPEAPMLAGILQDAGYATGHFGKWHMGGQRDVHEAPLITEYGFDESVTNFEGLGARVLPLKYSPGAAKPVMHNLGSDNLGHGPVIWHDRAFVTEKFVEAATVFARFAHKQGRPFYLNLWPDDVHTPMHPPLDQWGDGSDRHLYCRVLEEMDRQLAPLFTLVRDNPELRQNTLILICSDNGPEVGFGSAGHLRGHKATLYEGGIRSSLVAWGPGLMEEKAQGTRNAKSIFSAIDLVPSILDIAGVDPGDEVSFDGENLSRVLLGENQESQKAPLFFRRPPDRATFRHYTDLPDFAVRSGKWKLYTDYDGKNPELYDLESDPSEKNSVSEKHEEVVSQLTSEVLKWNQALPQDKGRELEKKAKAAKKGN